MTEERNRIDEAAAERALRALAAEPPAPSPALFEAMQAQARDALAAASTWAPASAPIVAQVGRSTDRRGALPAPPALRAGGSAPPRPVAPRRGRWAAPLDAVRRSAPPAAFAASALVGLALGYAAPAQFASAGGPFGLLEDPALELVDLALSLPAEATP
ncbi:MAG: hypothetical protein AAF763_17630 [Pseudomonadota bacterium]